MVKYYDPKNQCFKMPCVYLDHCQYLIEAIDKAGILNQRYGEKKKDAGLRVLEKKSQVVKIYRRRLKAIKDNFDVIQLQLGTRNSMNANDVIEKLYSLLGSRTTGNKSDEVGNEAIDLVD